MRVVVDIIIAVSVIFGLWYAALPIALVSAWVFPFYLELMIAGFAFDSLFGFGSGLGVVAYAGTLVSISSFIVLYLFKKMVR